MNYEKSTKVVKLVVEVVNEGHMERDPRFDFPSTEENAAKMVFIALATASFKEKGGVYGDDQGRTYCYLGGYKVYKPTLM